MKRPIPHDLYANVVKHLSWTLRNWTPTNTDNERLLANQLAESAIHGMRGAAYIPCPTSLLQEVLSALWALGEDELVDEVEKLIQDNVITLTDTKQEP